MKKRIEKKVRMWREQSEPERLRTASYLTLGGGIIIVILWLAVLLPLQLWVQRDDGIQQAAENGILKQIKEQVAGVRDENQVSDPSPSPQPTRSSLPARTYVPSSLPVAPQEQLLYEEPSPLPSLVPLSPTSTPSPAF